MSYDLNAKLSKNFTLRELVRSRVGERHGIDNAAHLTDEIVARLTTVTKKILQPCRDYIQIPFSPSSGFRSPTVNTIVGSKTTSQHLHGYAVDFEIPGVSNFVLAQYIYEHLDFDQLILECYTMGEPASGWVHASYVSPEDNRRSTLTWTGSVAEFSQMIGGSLQGIVIPVEMRGKYLQGLHR